MNTSRASEIAVLWVCALSYLGMFSNVTAYFEPSEFAVSCQYLQGVKFLFFSAFSYFSTISSKFSYFLAILHLT